jgi:hypothetical protein
MKLEMILDPSFKTGLAKLATADLPMNVAFMLDDAVASIEAELQKYEKVRQTALRKYGKMKEDGNFEIDNKGNVLFKTEKDSRAFMREHVELVNTEVQVQKIKRSDLGDLNVKMTVEELRKLRAVLFEA